MKWPELLNRYLWRKKSRSHQTREFNPGESTIQRPKHRQEKRRLSLPKFGTVSEATKTIPRVAATSRAYWIFEVVAGMDRGRQFVSLTNEIKIGRQFDNHIQLNDPKVSRFHAVIVRKGAMLLIRDLNSTNGTWVNQEKIGKPRRLESGDQIRIGTTVITVRFEKE